MRSVGAFGSRKLPSFQFWLNLFDQFMDDLYPVLVLLCKRVLRVRTLRVPLIPLETCCSLGSYPVMVFESQSIITAFQ